MGRYKITKGTIEGATEQALDSIEKVVFETDSFEEANDRWEAADSVIPGSPVHEDVGDFGYFLDTEPDKPASEELATFFSNTLVTDKIKSEWSPTGYAIVIDMYA